jgi:hypothetical protein
MTRTHVSSISLIAAIGLMLALTACGGTGSHNDFVQPPPPPQPLVITTSSLPDGNVTQSYSATLTASGGGGNYVWSLKSGALPVGLALAPSGVITGQPSVVATSMPFTVAVKDGSGSTVTANLAIKVTGPIVAGGLADATLGQIYSTTVTATGGTPPYTWSVMPTAGGILPLPDGLTLTPAGVLSGIPAQAGQQVAMLAVKDSAGVTEQMAIPLNVQQAPLQITTSQLPAARLNIAYDAHLAVIGADPTTVAFSLSAGSVPAGLNLTPTGEIAGTPTAAGVYSFTVQAQTASATTTRTIGLKVVSSAIRNNDIANATALSNGTFTASISPYIDETTGLANPDTDYYQLTGAAGSTVAVETFAMRLDNPSPLDTVIEIVDANGNRFGSCNNPEEDNPTIPVIAADATPGAYNDACINDDIETGILTDSQLTFRVPGSLGSAVTFYVHILDLRGDARPDMLYEISISGLTAPSSQPVPPSGGVVAAKTGGR